MNKVRQLDSAQSLTLHCSLVKRSNFSNIFLLKIKLCFGDFSVNVTLSIDLGFIVARFQDCLVSVRHLCCTYGSARVTSLPW